MPKNNTSFKPSSVRDEFFVAAVEVGVLIGLTCDFGSELAGRTELAGNTELAGRIELPGRIKLAGSGVETIEDFFLNVSLKGEEDSNDNALVSNEFVDATTNLK